MSYTKAGTQKYTLIDDLPDIDELENQHRNGIPNDQQEKYQKFIRDNHNSVYDQANHSSQNYNSYMHNDYNSYAHNQQQQTHQYSLPQQNYRPQNQFNPDFQLPPVNANSFPDNYHQHLYEGFSPVPSGPPPVPPTNYGPCTCLDVNGHIENCPICSRFYKNKYYVVYIVIIVVLTVICLILLKKVLDK